MTNGHISPKIKQEPTLFPMITSKLTYQDQSSNIIILYNMLFP